MDTIINLINILLGAALLWYGIRKYNLMTAITVTASYLIYLYNMDWLSVYTALVAVLIFWGWYRGATWSLYIGMALIIGFVYWMVCLFAGMHFSWILVAVGLVLAIGGTYAVRKHLKPIVVGSGGGSSIAMGLLAFLDLSGGFTDIGVTLVFMAAGIMLQYFLLKQNPDWQEYLVKNED